MPPRKNRRAGGLNPHRLRALSRTARAAAARAGEVVQRRFRWGGVRMKRKAVGDFVTAVDLAIEKLLRREILAEWPDHGVFGEELPPVNAGADFVWILDPIDGTSNFGRGLPIYAVSVACLHAGRPVAAAVHCLPEDRTYHAALGSGARCDRRVLELGRRGDLDDAAILGVQWHRTSREIPYLPKLIATGARVRNFGSTVAQLCDVAAGRLDANVQEQGKIWDFAAAALLVTEAGGRFTSWDGTDIFPLHDLDGERHYPSIAAHPRVHRTLCRILGRFEQGLVVPGT